MDLSTVIIIVVAALWLATWRPRSTPRPAPPSTLQIIVEFDSRNLAEWKSALAAASAGPATDQRAEVAPCPPTLSLDVHVARVNSGVRSLDRSADEDAKPDRPGIAWNLDDRYF